jgi:hypothetical protein
MADIGFRLQQARLQRAMTLRQISHATKISLSVLEALEHSDFSRLPGGIFTRGYIRAYAAHVGLDPEELVGELPATRAQADEDQSPSMPSWMARRSSLHESPRSLLLLLVFLLATVIVFVWESATPPSAPEVAVVADLDVGADKAAMVLDATTENSGSAIDKSEPALPNQQGLKLELRPHGPCWVSASADGRVVVYRLMQPGERATVDARDEIQLRVGDAGTFAYLINGVAGRSLGRPGQAVTLRITNGNYDALQAATAPDGDTRPRLAL